MEFHLMEGTDLKQLKGLRPHFQKIFVDIGGVVALPYLDPVLKQLEVPEALPLLTLHPFQKCAPDIEP